MTLSLYLSNMNQLYDWIKLVFKQEFSLLNSISDIIPLTKSVFFFAHCKLIPAPFPCIPAHWLKNESKKYFSGTTQILSALNVKISANIFMEKEISVQKK